MAGAVTHMIAIHHRHHASHEMPQTSYFSIRILAIAAFSIHVGSPAVVI